jgi:aminoglycoside 6'-N-acetyltransferase
VTELRGAAVLLRPVSERDVGQLRRIRHTPKIQRWWGEGEDDDWPLGDDPDTTLFTVLVDGRVAGLIQYGEITDPQYRHAGIDLFLDPALHGRGPERDTDGSGWHDGLLMDLLASELT